MNPAPSNYFQNTRPELLSRFPRVAQHVLEVGCGAGYFGAALLERGLARKVSGIEPNPSACEAAKSNLSEVFCGTVEGFFDSTTPIEKCFDCIVLNDVIEHTQDPDSVIARLVPLLSPDGFIVASVPNVRFHKVVRKLVFAGDWTYTDEGVLDRTHLRFFTRSTAIALFGRHGLLPAQVEGINPAPFPRWLTFLNWVARGKFDDMRYQQFFMHLDRLT